MNRQPEDRAEASGAERDAEEAVRQAKRTLLDGVCRTLEGRYGRRFDVCRVISDPGAARVRMLARTRDEPQVRFAVELGGDAGTPLRDDYVAALCLSELRAALERALPGTAVSASFPGGIVPQTDAGLTLAAYLRRRGDRRVLARVLCPENARPERDAVVSAVQSACVAYGADIAAYVYVLRDGDFAACRRRMEALPALTGAMIRGHGPVESFSLLAENGAVRVSEVR